MIKLNLTAKTNEQNLIKKYLENNVSELLADKINNGIKVVKDDKTLISKKDLDSFMAYASGEARKLANNNAQSACVEDKVVYGWAVHYFEEDSIEGSLYNEDGTPYSPPKKEKTKTTTKQTAKTTTIKNSSNQSTIFDFLGNEEVEQNELFTDNENVVEDKIQTATKNLENEIRENQTTIEDFINTNETNKNSYIVDKSTGEVIKVEQTIIDLSNLLDGKMEVKL